MSIYFTDLIELTSVSYDGNGVPTESAAQIKARVEDTNRMFNSADGSNIRAQSLIFFSVDYDVKQGDEIRILKIRGRDYRDTARRFKIIEAMNNAGFSIGKWEVYI